MEEEVVVAVLGRLGAGAGEEEEEEEAINRGNLGVGLASMLALILGGV